MFQENTNVSPSWTENPVHQFCLLHHYQFSNAISINPIYSHTRPTTPSSREESAMGSLNTTVVIMDTTRSTKQRKTHKNHLAWRSGVNLSEAWCAVLSECTLYVEHISHKMVAWNPPLLHCCQQWVSRNLLEINLLHTECTAWQWSETKIFYSAHKRMLTPGLQSRAGFISS